MCGLAGKVGEPRYSDAIFFEALLHMNVTRGRDSTGVVAANAKNKVQWAKGLKTPEKLIFDKVYEDVRNLDKPVSLIGHTRWMTRGAVSLKNAHPFQHGKVLGCHNGTLKKKFFNQYDTDSEGLIRQIDEKGIEETWKDMDGAAAITWYNRDRQSVNIARNAERTLYYAATDNNKQIWWASEAWMLHQVARLGLPLGDIKEVPTHYHFELSYKKNKVEVRKQELTPFVYKIPSSNSSRSSSRVVYPAAVGHPTITKNLAGLLGFDKLRCINCEQPITEPLNECIHYGGQAYTCRKCSDYFEEQGYYRHTC